MEDRLDIVERLNEELGKAEHKIRKLEDEKRNVAYANEWHWRQIRQISEEDNLNLPIPRLEIRYRVEDYDKYNEYADYGLVLKHYMKHIDFIPLSSTRVSIGYAEKLRLPWRDGAHIIHDKENLKVPAYVVYKDKTREITYTNPGERKDVE